MEKNQKIDHFWILLHSLLSVTFMLVIILNISFNAFSINAFRKRRQNKWRKKNTRIDGDVLKDAHEYKKKKSVHQGLIFFSVWIANKKRVMHKTMENVVKRNVWRRLKDVIWTRYRVFVYVVLTQNYVHVVTIQASKIPMEYETNERMG